MLTNGKRDAYKRAVGRTTPRCGFRNRTAKPKRCHLLATNRWTRTLVWGKFGFMVTDKVSVAYGLRRCECFRNSLERTSWGTWWNIKAHQALVQKIPSHSQSLQQQLHWSAFAGSSGCVIVELERYCLRKEKKKKKAKTVLDALPALSKTTKSCDDAASFSSSYTFFLRRHEPQMQRCRGNIGMHGPFKSRRAATGLVTGCAGPHVWGDSVVVASVARR